MLGRTIVVAAFCAALSGTASLGAQRVAVHAPLRVRASEDGHFLVTEDGRPYFYLGDTGWELFHRLTRDDAVRYLQFRADEGYTAIQAVLLAEFDGLTVPNAYGDLPLIERDPTRPAITPGADPESSAQYDYWDHVDFVVREAEKRGLHVAMLPTWGRWVNNPQAPADVVFDERNAEAYGRFVGARYKDHPIIWVLGGDRHTDGVEKIWRAMARGIAIGTSGREDYSRVTMTFHPCGACTSSTAFHDDAWLDFNMQQTSHGLAVPTRSWSRIAADYARTPAKPVIDGEPLYEDHPLDFRSALNGYSFDAHVRQRAYWDVFAGAAGITYGNHAVWQFYAPGREPINGPLMYWTEAIHRPGGAQFPLLRRLMESRPYFSRVPDQSIVADTLTGADHLQATRGDGYLFVYTAQGRPINLVMGKISGDSVAAWWFNPRSGDATSIGRFVNAGTRTFASPAQGFGADWVLVADDGRKRFAAPGAPSARQRGDVTPR